MPGSVPSAATALSCGRPSPELRCRASPSCSRCSPSSPPAFGPRIPAIAVPSHPKHGGSKSVPHAGARRHQSRRVEGGRHRAGAGPRPAYVYLCGFVNFDVQIYDISNPSAPKKIYTWTIENPELHRGIGAMDGKYFKIGNRYYYAQSYQFMQGSPDADLGAVDLRRDRPARSEQGQGGRAHPLSRSRRAASTTPSRTSTPTAACCTSRRSTSRRRSSTISAKVVSGADPSTLARRRGARIPTPFKQIGGGGYHDFYVGYDPATQQDKFYGAGLGGYSVWDVTQPGDAQAAVHDHRASAWTSPTRSRRRPTAATR